MDTITTRRPITGASTSTAISLLVDPWIASSLLQKAIRRGEADLAANAALTLYRARGAAIWRRFMVIAFEDVGAGCVEAVHDTVTLATDRNARAAAGSDAEVAVCLARRLAHATKDRSADYLMGAVQHHPSLDVARERVGGGSFPGRFATLRDTSLPLPVRAVAAWYLSSLYRTDEKRLGRADLANLLNAYRMLGAPDRLANATMLAAKRTREPITVMVPLILLAVRADGKLVVRQEGIRPSRWIEGIPAYTFDKHTRIGKRAISIFIRENDAVRTCLEDHLPDFRHRGAAAVAAFYADAMPVMKRLDWDASDELERMGMESDMAREGVPLSAVSAIVGTVRANLDHLDEIRARLCRPSDPSREAL